MFLILTEFSINAALSRSSWHWACRNIICCCTGVMLGLMGKQTHNYIKPATFFTYLHATFIIHEHYRHALKGFALLTLQYFTDGSPLRVMNVIRSSSEHWQIHCELWTAFFFNDLQRCIPLWNLSIKPDAKTPNQISRAKKQRNKSLENGCFWSLTNICHIVVYYRLYISSWNWWFTNLSLIIDHLSK